jgi:serpin B
MSCAIQLHAKVTPNQDITAIYPNVSHEIPRISNLQMKKIIILLVSLILCTGLLGQTNSIQRVDVADIGQMDNSLGFQVLQCYLRARPPANTCQSPFGLGLVLSMIEGGASGSTEAEIDKALGISGKRLAKLKQANLDLIRTVTSVHPSSRFEIANSFWKGSRFVVNTEFKNDLQYYYKADVEDLDLNSPVKMNEWVKEATHGAITQMADSPLSENVSTIIINALYFKCNWKTPFVEGKSHPEPFHLLDGHDVQVAMMERRGFMDYLETKEFQAIKLPYSDANWNCYFFTKGESRESCE